MQLKAILSSVGSSPPIPRIAGTRCGVINGKWWRGGRHRVSSGHSSRRCSSSRRRSSTGTAPAWDRGIHTLTPTHLHTQLQPCFGLSPGFGSKDQLEHAVHSSERRTSIMPRCCAAEANEAERAHLSGLPHSPWARHVDSPLPWRES